MGRLASLTTILLSLLIGSRTRAIVDLRRHTGKLALCAILLMGSIPLAHQPDTRRTLLPVDEAASMPDFFAFRARLLRVVAARDASGLLDVVDPAIRNSFGGDDGRESFVEIWKPASPDSRVWEVLGTVLGLGGAVWGRDGFAAPYVSARWPGEVDGFEHVAVIGADVPIRAASRDDAAELERSSFGILRLADGADPTSGEWVAVRASTGRAGYVRARMVRSPIDYRAYFEKKNGSWRLVMLVAGD